MIRTQRRGCIEPSVVIMASTYVLASAPETKNMITRMMATTEVTAASGK